MLHKRAFDLTEKVWIAAAKVGRNAARIADDIIGEVFPRTMAEAEIEGADRIVRVGLIFAVKRILRNTAPTDGQRDFSEIAPQFRSHVAELKSAAYFVEKIGEHVSVGRLIAEPSLLDDARKFMRRKSEECRDEAERLDALYRAVTEAA